MVSVKELANGSTAACAESSTTTDVASAMGVESSAFVDSTVVAVSTGGSSTGVTGSTSFCSTGAESISLRAAGS